MPSTLKNPARMPMWKGAVCAFAVTAFCFFPLSIGGYWAYRDKMLWSGILFSILAFHGKQISRFLLGIIFIFVVLESLCNFHIYAMPVFDLAEQAYTRRTNKKIDTYLRFLGRTFFIFCIFLVAIAIPFLSSLAGLLGGLSIPLAFLLPSLMYLRLSIAVSAGGVWSVVETVVKVQFFNPA